MSSEKTDNKEGQKVKIIVSVFRDKKMYLWNFYKKKVEGTKMSSEQWWAGSGSKDLSRTNGYFLRNFAKQAQGIIKN